MHAPLPVRFLFSLTLAGLVSLSTAGPLGFAAEPQLDYNRDIRPILSDNCYECHGPDESKREAGLRLDLAEAALAELESGAFAIKAGDSTQSGIIQRITATDPDERMPPADSGKSLSAKQIAQIRQWVDAGAPFSEHWSFVAPQRPALPAVSSPSWPQSAIDYFVLEKLEQAGLEPSPEADRRTWVRRVTLDLTGLPPTLRDVDDFVADTQPGAFERVVDRLLASPQYGEHMARFWMDVARYGDTHGLHLDNKRSIWPYRDWVIGAFNKNMPFDQFTREQLAGDLMPNPTIDQLVATGFNRCNVTTSEGGSIDDEYYVRYAVDRVETTATVWMGLTAGCAVCHDHKFDPISQKEFFGLFAYFYSLTEKAMDGNALLPPPSIEVPTERQTRLKKEYQQTLASLEQAIQEELGRVEYQDPLAKTDAAGSAAGESTEAESQSAWEGAQGDEQKKALPKAVREALKVEREKRNDQQRKLVQDYYIQNVYQGTREVFDPLNKRLAEATKQLDDLQKSIPATLVMEERKEPRTAYVLKRGQYDQPDESQPVPPSVPAALPALPDDAPKNRLALARWLVDPDHPLTARVAVNRFWQQYFGTGIVKTAEDFGAQGEWPSHPELLDWLATEWIRSGWDVKWLQKAIVTSATYRQASRVTPDRLEMDPHNRLLSRGPRYRLDAETVRDNALAVSGLLVGQIGGPSVKPYQPPGLWKAVGYSGSNTVQFQRDDGRDLYRRGMYTFWKRTSPPPAMSTFDAPSRENCTARRARTNTPLQALVLMNDEQFVEAARHLAERMMTEAGDQTDDRMTLGFRLATARPPGDEEIRLLGDVFAFEQQRFREDQEAAKKLLSVGASPRNESLDESELAAWTVVANLILNLDETVTK